MKIAFDVKLKRPACVLLQAAMGCYEARHKVHRFPTESWILAPTPDLAVYECTDEQFEKLIKMVQKEFPSV